MSLHAWLFLHSRAIPRKNALLCGAVQSIGTSSGCPCLLQRLRRSLAPGGEGVEGGEQRTWINGRGICDGWRNGCGARVQDGDEGAEEFRVLSSEFRLKGVNEVADVPGNGDVGSHRQRFAGEVGFQAAKENCGLRSLNRPN